MAAVLEIRDSSGVTFTVADFGYGPNGATSNAATLRIHNTGDATPTTVLIGAITSRNTFTGARNSQGQEAVTEQWIQAKEGAGAWTPIGGDTETTDNRLSITPPDADDYTEIQIRVVIPATTETGGNIAALVFAEWT